MSGIGKLNLPDWVKGAVMAGLGAVFGFIQQLISTGATLAAIDWSKVWPVALGAALAYITKNVFTDNQGKAFGIEATKPSEPVVSPAPTVGKVG